MSRKNIFQLVEQNYDVQNEIKKINSLFFNENYFSVGEFFNYTFEKLISTYLFEGWKYRGTCISVKGFMRRVNAEIDYKDKKIISEDIIINNLELMENFVKLYFDHSNELVATENIKYYTKFTDIFYNIIETLEKRIGLSKRTYKDRVILYPKNVPLEKAINLIDDADVQWEMISYVRENKSLSGKRKSLAYLATNLYIEKDKKETDPILSEIIDQATNVLNNLHIRHNNQTGKWEHADLINSLSEKEAKELCDFVFNKILLILLLRDNKKYEMTYNKFKEFQKKTGE